MRTEEASPIPSFLLEKVWVDWNNRPSWFPKILGSLMEPVLSFWEYIIQFKDSIFFIIPLQILNYVSLLSTSSLRTVNLKIIHK